MPAMTSLLLLSVLLLSMAIFLHSSLASQDLVFTQYSSQGELKQLSYASAAIQRSLPLIAFVHKHDKHDEEDVIVCFRVRRRVNPKLQVEQDDSCFERPIGSNHDQLLITSLGYIPDCHSSALYANTLIQSHKLSFGECPSPRTLAVKLSRWLTRGLHRGGGGEEEEDGSPVARPMACSMILLQPGQSAITHIANTGVVVARKTLSLGAISREVRAEIEDALKLPALAAKVEAVARSLLRSEENQGGNKGDGDVMLEMAVLTSQTRDHGDDEEGEEDMKSSIHTLNAISSPEKAVEFVRSCLQATIYSDSEHRRQI